MLSGRSYQKRPIQDCIHHATQYRSDLKNVLKKAKLELTVASDNVESSRFKELTRVAEIQTVLKFDFTNIMTALTEKIDKGTSTHDFCVAIVKVAAYLEPLAKLLFILQESRKQVFYAEKAIDLVKEHLTKERTIEEMEKKNNEMIKNLGEASEGSAADDHPDEKTQFGNSALTDDKLDAVDSELQDAIDQGLKQDIDATLHVLAWGVEAVQEVNGYMENHHLSLYPLVKTMFFKGMDDRDDRGWIHDLRGDLNNIVGMSIRVETVMQKVYTLENACGDDGQESQSDESDNGFGTESQPY